MKIGFGAPVAGAWATPEYLAALSGRAEDAGYASLWSFQRLLVPEGSGMEPVYRSVLDPMVALGYLSAVTFLLDVDNTLLDNDAVQADLREHLEADFGTASRDRYWDIFEQLRDELGYADYLGALQRFRASGEVVDRDT